MYLYLELILPGSLDAVVARLGWLHFGTLIPARSQLAICIMTDCTVEGNPTPPTPTAEIKSNIALIGRAVADLEPRFTHRVLRSLTALRKRLDNKILHDAVEENYP